VNVSSPLPPYSVVAALIPFDRNPDVVCVVANQSG
jgi:hypothetical protein